MSRNQRRGPDLQHECKCIVDREWEACLCRFCPTISTPALATSKTAARTSTIPRTTHATTSQPAAAYCTPSSDSTIWTSRRPALPRAHYAPAGRSLTTLPATRATSEPDSLSATAADPVTATAVAFAAATGAKSASSAASNASWRSSASSLAFTAATRNSTRRAAADAAAGAATSFTSPGAPCGPTSTATAASASTAVASAAAIAAFTASAIAASAGSST